ncbi:MAG: hypothetical protein IJ617_03655 [Oscillospiraceae bacterium]|nr:hypothetical protein [Oscillospiraceae bacterium]
MKMTEGFSEILPSFFCQAVKMQKIRRLFPVISQKKMAKRKKNRKKGLPISE